MFEAGHFSLVFRPLPLFFALLLLDTLNALFFSFSLSVSSFAHALFFFWPGFVLLCFSLSAGPQLSGRAFFCRSARWLHSRKLAADNQESPLQSCGAVCVEAIVSSSPSRDPAPFAGHFPDAECQIRDDFWPEFWGARDTLHAWKTLLRRQSHSVMKWLVKQRTTRQSTKAVDNLAAYFSVPFWRLHSFVRFLVLLTLDDSSLKSFFFSSFFLCLSLPYFSLCFSLILLFFSWFLFLSIRFSSLVRSCPSLFFLLIVL